MAQAGFFEVSEGSEGSEVSEGSEDNSDPDFEHDSSPSSLTSSSGDESIISEDLNLYEATCVCQLLIEYHKLKCKRV